MQKHLLRFMQESEELEKLIPAHIEKLEEKKDTLDERIDEYESKDHLTERQEDILSELENKVANIDSEIEMFDNILSSIEDIRIELIGYYSSANVSADYSFLIDNDLEDVSYQPKQPSILGTAIKAVIATELTIDFNKKS